MNLVNIEKILFITLSNIGDAILTLPVLTALKDAFPQAKIDVVVGPRPKEIFIKDPRVNRIFVYDKHVSLGKKMYFISSLRKESYDLAVDMRSSLIPILIGAKKRSALVGRAKFKNRHKRLIHLSKLKGLGIEYDEKKNIYIDEKDRARVRGLLEKNGIKKDDFLIGVSPSCRSLLKQWDTGSFIEVIKEILDKKDTKVILIGDESQVSISKRIGDSIDDKNLIDLTGKTSLGELFALIESFNMLLTCDSACMHIACNLGVKVAAIFGPTDVEEYGPTGKKDIVIRKELKCSPCRKAVCRLNHECMKGIRPEEVLRALSLR